MDGKRIRLQLWVSYFSFCFVLIISWFTLFAIIDPETNNCSPQDTAGQERFRYPNYGHIHNKCKSLIWNIYSRTITSSYYRGAHGILLAYAINDEGTFKNVATWLDEVDGFVPKNIPKVLVGTKSDLSDQREVTTEQGQSFAREHGN